jgi:hypothetical protein
MTSKWEKFDEHVSESKNKETEGRAQSNSSQQATTSGESTVANQALKQKVVDDMLHLRDSVSGAIESSQGKLSADKLKDLEDAEDTIDGAVGMISPANALANQQQAEQSAGLGMGGSSSGSDREDDE